MAGRRGAGNASAVGMMEGAFFVGRMELISWVNSLLQVGITKVEQCASGAIYCQILDSCHPNTVAMRKVNWMAKSDHEFIPNFKILQNAFDKNCIQRNIAVDALIRGKYQDNLEFLQWMKCYWDREGSALEDYDPCLAREAKPVPPWAHAKSNETAKESVKLRGGTPAAAGAPKDDALPKPKTPPAARPTPKASGRPRTDENQASGRVAVGRAAVGAPAADRKLVEELQERAANQQDEIEELRSTFEGVEQERDYYFRKLREVEILCTTLKAQFETGEQLDPNVTPERIVDDVQGILYAEGEEGEGAEEGVDVTA